jgi:hypothetical protein
MECVRRVAVAAAKIAPGEAHEGARKAGPGSLPLNAEEDFGDSQRRATLTQKASEPDSAPLSEPDSLNSFL